MLSYLQQGHDVFSKVVLRETILPRLLSLTRESRTNVRIYQSSTTLRHSALQNDAERG